FFFFQAEDGIRDGHVTGVQTCALPISLKKPFRKTLCCKASILSSNFWLLVSKLAMVFLKFSANSGSFSITPRALLLVFNLEVARSEERRVGKECRSRMEEE